MPGYSNPETALKAELFILAVASLPKPATIDIVLLGHSRDSRLLKLESTSQRLMKCAHCPILMIS
jgi:nucleotide-binding universal stress UspA family protein